MYPSVSGSLEAQTKLFELRLAIEYTRTSRGFNIILKFYRV